jgi:hypothetical protein
MTRLSILLRRVIDTTELSAVFLLFLKRKGIGSPMRIPPASTHITVSRPLSFVNRCRCTSLKLATDQSFILTLLRDHLSRRFNKKYPCSACFSRSSSCLSYRSPMPTQRHGDQGCTAEGQPRTGMPPFIHFTNSQNETGGSSMTVAAIRKHLLQENSSSCLQVVTSRLSWHIISSRRVWEHALQA